MTTIFRFLTLLALIGLVLPGAAAQDNDKKDPAKDEKKDDKKKDGDDPPKKDDPAKKKEKEPEEKVVYGQVIRAKIKRMDANSARDFGIDWPQLDQQKVAALNQWKQQRMVQIYQQQNPAQRAQQMYQFQQELARKNNDVYTMKEIGVRAGDGCKVRSMFIPAEFDDRGFPKKWTPKELAAKKGNSKYPGYVSDFDTLRVGQVVDLYMAKTKAQAPKKKTILDDEPIMDRPEVVMIIVIQDAPLGR